VVRLAPVPHVAVFVRLLPAQHPDRRYDPFFGLQKGDPQGRGRGNKCRSRIKFKNRAVMPSLPDFSCEINCFLRRFMVQYLQYEKRRWPYGSDHCGKAQPCP
jgi:hypothetical protein